MLVDFRSGVHAIIRRFKPTHFVYEAPILVVKKHNAKEDARPTDKLEKLRKLYSLGPFLEVIALDNGIVCVEEPVKALKRELTGNRHAEKGDMVAVARKMGIALPPTKAAGMEDAADAAAAWLIGVRHYAKPHLSRWDRVIYSRRGGALI